MRERNIDTPRSDSNYDHGSAADEAEYRENLARQRAKVEEEAEKQHRVNEKGRKILESLNIKPKKEPKEKLF